MGPPGKLATSAISACQPPTPSLFRKHFSPTLRNPAFEDVVTGGGRGEAIEDHPLPLDAVAVGERALDDDASQPLILD